MCFCASASVGALFIFTKTIRKVIQTMKTNPTKLIFSILIALSLLLTSCNDSSKQSSNETSENGYESSETTVSEFISETLSTEISENVSDTLSAESSDGISESSLDMTSEDVSYISEDTTSEETSNEISETTSEESSNDISETTSENTSNEISETTSEESSNDISDITSEESSDISENTSSEESADSPTSTSSEESSEPVTEESSEEPSSEESSEELSEEAKKINQEIMQEFPNLDFSYALYDISTGQTVVKYNTQQLFQIGDSIKALYVWYLLSEEKINLKDKILLEAEHVADGQSYINANIGKNYFVGQSRLTIHLIISCCITYSDNTAYNMLISTYGNIGFNAFMEKLNISIRIGKESIEKNEYYALATTDDFLKAWIHLNTYLSNANSVSSYYLSNTLKVKYGIKFAENIINCSTLSMAGLVNSTSTANECYIVEGKYIAIICTSTGKKTPLDKQINTDPLEKIAVKLHELWETNFSS